jgi:hypothetical protein
MKNPLNFIHLGAVVAVMLVCAIACKKDSSSTTSTNDDQTTATLAAGATSSESIYDDTFDVVTQSSEQAGISTKALEPSSGGMGRALNNQSLSSYVAVACATITLAPADTTTFPKTMTIDYGTGCTSTNGITRKGKLIVTLTARLSTPGATISITFDSYSVNGYTITGTYAITPVAGTSGALNYTISVTNGSITIPSGAMYSYSATETYTQVAGIGTTTITDDTYNITGSITYSGGGLTVTGTIVTPLVRAEDCPNITQGTIDYVYNNVKGVLDFGSGTCDNVATVKVGPITNTVTLPR